ncbi:hypothetical protein B7463_g2569, partial [Scytalidium lignicola]
MAGFFSRLRGKDGPIKAGKSRKNAVQTPQPAAPAKPQWEDAWTRKTVEPEEVQELLRGCTVELKSRALDTPFLVLPFRPTSDPSAARSFIRSFFQHGDRMHGETLAQELRLTEPMVLCSVVKWCWSRLPSGVVGWESYELFRVGEHDSNMARDAFATFIPLSVDSDARTKIIFDFFDLLAAIAAHGKLNGLGGRKLSRLAGWWAFEHSDTGNGFEGGYKSWASAADATSHLFFAYLRSLAPDSVKGMNGISTLPMSLQKLVQETEYPPERPALMQISTHKVVMIVDTVSPTPFALLRRANHFQYRDDDRALQDFSEYEDPIQALTDECRRVLRSISNVNQSQISSVNQSTGLRDASWSRFEDLGFSGALDENDEEEDGGVLSKTRSQQPQGLRSTPRSLNAGMGGRPTTPSWADFLSSGFADEAKASPPPLLLPPDKVLPPIDTRGRSSQSHKPRLESNRDLEPGELASITKFDLDDAFWWVWISSLAGEEPSERKAAFGRCALVETIIRGGKWLVFEEMVKGAAPEPVPGAYIAEKKSRFGWTRRNKGMSRSKSTNGKHPLHQNGSLNSGKPSAGMSKTSIGPDQHARIQAAAAQLQEKQRAIVAQQQQQQQQNERRGRTDPDTISHKTSSVFTLQPVIMSEASPALKWASKYDKDAIREAYLSSSNMGRGVSPNMSSTNGNASTHENIKPASSPIGREKSRERDLPVPPPATPPVAAPASTSTPITPTPDKQQLSEKAVEAISPNDVHPVNRDAGGASSPMPPPKQSIEEPRPSTPERATPTVELSPASKAKQNKLHKKEKNTSGFKKMFGRKNRSSKVPENAGEIINGNGNGATAAATAGGRFMGMGKATPTASSLASEPSHGYAESSQASTAGDGSITPVASPRPAYEPSYDPSIQDSVSDAHEAKQEFSKFDQGPLEDVPAFVPESPLPRGELTPSVISREESQKEETTSLAQLKGVSSPAIQDRWAQLRKNAEQRAAQTIQRPSDEQSSSRRYSNKTDGDDETSGEETIESRVARIKARVAELTGNMETTSGPAPGLKK